MKPLEETQQDMNGRIKDFNSTWQKRRANEDLPEHFSAITLSLDEESETEDFHGFQVEMD